MRNFLKKYGELKSREFSANLKRMRNMKMCYLFLLPFAVLFIAFYILPMFTSIFYSFTNFNMLEKPEFIGFRNYINLFLKDEVNQTAIKNTFIIAVITGPAGYIISFLIAWLINELPKWMRTIAVVIFYSPSIAGNVYIMDIDYRLIIVYITYIGLSILITYYAADMAQSAYLCGHISLIYFPKVGITRNTPHI